MVQFVTLTMTDVSILNTVFGLILKLGFLTLTGIFIGFAILFIRQVKIMTQSVHDPLNPKLTILSWLYLVLVLTIFAFLIFYL